MVLIANQSLQRVVLGAECSCIFLGQKYVKEKKSDSKCIPYCISSGCRLVRNQTFGNFRYQPSKTEIWLTYTCQG